MTDTFDMDGSGDKPCSYCSGAEQVEFRDPDVGHMPCPVCQPDAAYAHTHHLAAVIWTTPSGEPSAFKDRLAAVKEMLTTKEEIERLRNRVDVILEQIANPPLTVGPSMVEIRTPEEWSEELGIWVMDPDGWRGVGQPDWSEPITRADFERRAMFSTIERKAKGS